MAQRLANPLNYETIDRHFLYVDRTWAQFQYLQKGYADTIGAIGNSIFDRGKAAISNQTFKP